MQLVFYSFLPPISLSFTLHYLYRTLSPLNTFSSELGVQFGTCLEAPHVIDVDSQVERISYIIYAFLVALASLIPTKNWFFSHLPQVWASVISNGPGNYPLNASYKTADGYNFQVLQQLLLIPFQCWIEFFLLMQARSYFFLKDALGKSLEEICKIVPGGCLVFFPSYKLLDKVSKRWQETGQWSHLNAQKSLFVGKICLIRA